MLALVSQLEPRSVLRLALPLEPQLVLQLVLQLEPQSVLRLALPSESQLVLRLELQLGLPLKERKDCTQ